MIKYILLLLLPFTLEAQTNFKNQYDFFCDFTTGVGADQIGEIFASNTGTGASSAGMGSPASGNEVGIVQSTTGTTTTGRTFVGTALTAFHLGGGQWSFECDLTAISALCSATEGYALWVGFFDNVAATQTDGVYFLYDSLGVSTGSFSSDQWQTVTASNSSRTYTETGIDVTTSGAKLKMIINFDATSVDFYIDGVMTRTETATIPVGAGRELAFGWCILKSAGSTARTVNIDYIHVMCDYTTPK